MDHSARIEFPPFCSLELSFHRSLGDLFTPYSSAELIFSYIVTRMTVQRALQTVNPTNPPDGTSLVQRCHTTDDGDQYGDKNSNETTRNKNSNETTRKTRDLKSDWQ